MKTTGSPQTELERRAEAVLDGMPDINHARVTYAPAGPAVASPSYQGVESISFVVAPDGVSASLFLRLGIDEVADLIDVQIAYKAANRLHDLGLAPRPVHQDIGLRAIVFERLGDDWRTAKIDDLMPLDSAAALIAIHKTIAAGDRFGKTWSVFDGIDRLWSKLESARNLLPRDAEWMLAWMRPIRTAIEAGGIDWVAAHADPHSSNVMIDGMGRKQLIDFDMAADVDPYYQLGVQMNELYQFETQMKPLLEIHDGRFTDTAFNRCRLYAAADDLYWALRSTVLEATTTRQGIEFLKYAGWRFLRCRMLLGRPGFEELLRSI